jgi:hypothetical protein
MNYYQKYIKYKNKYLQLKETNYKYNQNGGSDNVLYNSNNISLPHRIKENKKEIFINIVLWIAEDSKYNKNTKMNKEGFNFPFNSENEELNKQLNNDNYQEYRKTNNVIQLKFNSNNDGFSFDGNIRCSKNEIFELIYIMNNIYVLQIPNNFDVFKLEFTGKNNIYSRIEFLKATLLNNSDATETMIEPRNTKSINDNKSETIEHNKIETIEHNKIETIEHNKIETIEHNKLETINHNKPETIKPLNDDVNYDKPFVPDFVPNVFYPSDYSVGMNFPISNKKLDDSPFISESSESSKSSGSSELYNYNE